MHILIVTNSFSRIQLFNFARILSAEHRVSVISFDRSSDLRSEGKQACYSSCTLVPWPRQSTLTCAVKSSLTFTPYCVLNNRSATMTQVIKHFMQRHTVDIVVFDQLAMGQYHVAVDGPVKVCYPVDAQSRQKRQRCRIEPSWIKRLIYHLDYLMVARYERRLYSDFDHMFLATEEDADYTRRACPSLRPTIHVVSSGVDIDYYRPIEMPAWPQKSLVFFGNLATTVNSEAVLWFRREIWPGLREAVPDLRWYIVGTAPPKHIADLAHQEGIVVTGFVEDYRSYIWDADVFVAPLVMGTGLKNKVVQAMAMGKAVVATPLAVEGIRVEHNEHLLVAEGADDFRRAVLTLLNDPALATRLGRAARERVEQEYSWEAITRNFINTIRAIRDHEQHRLPQTAACASRI